LTASDSAATAPRPPRVPSFARVTSRWAIKMNSSRMKANFNGKWRIQKIALLKCSLPDSAIRHRHDELLKLRSQNPGEKKFCGDCGALLANRCQKCVAENPLGKRFCGDCGTPLAANAPTSRAETLAATLTEPEIQVTPEQADAPKLTEGEHKAITALFADIKGSIELMEDLDPGGRAARGRPNA